MRDMTATRERQLGWYKEDTDFFTALRKKKKLISGTAVRGKDGNNHTQIDKKRELRNGLKAEMHKAKLGR